MSIRQIKYDDDDDDIKPDYFKVHSMAFGIERGPVLNATIVCYFI